MDINYKDEIYFISTSLTIHLSCNISPYFHAYTSQILQCFLTTVYGFSHIFNTYVASKFFQAWACSLEMFASRHYLRKQERA